MRKEIEMQKRRFGYFPSVFVWRDVEYNVDTTVRCRTTQARGRMSRHYFTVQCVGVDKLLTVYQEIETGKWYLE